MTGMFAPAFSYLNCRYSPTNLARDVPAEGCSIALRRCQGLLPLRDRKQRDGVQFQLGQG